MTGNVTGNGRWPPGRISTPQIARWAGISYRQLDYWIRSGWIPGQNGRQGSGKPREWTSEQVARVIEIRDAFNQAEDILRRARIGTDGTLNAMVAARSR